MGTHVRIEDRTIWFKHIEEPRLRERLENLKEDEAINLEVDGVIGRWKRMKKGKNPLPTRGIKPDGAMKRVWNEWYKGRRGQVIELREAMLADDYLAAASALFSEWNSPEDEEAFRDL